MANNKVKFLRGTSNEYIAAEKDNDTIYFTTDDGKLYIGDKEVSGESIKALNSHINDNVKHITSTERTNWNDAKTHADSAHAPSNAQVNVIETVKVNGTALTPSSKAVDITVPSYSAMTGATYSTAGTSGLVPAPAVDDIDKFLRGDGTWGALDSSIITQNIAGIPVDLTGIHNTQVIGYDEEQGKLVPMNAVARKQTVLPSAEVEAPYEITEQNNVQLWPYSSYNAPYLNTYSDVSSAKLATLKGYFKKSFLLSEFTTMTVGRTVSQDASLKIIFSKSFDFSVIDAEYSFSNLSNTSVIADITSLQGKYFIRFEFQDSRANDNFYFGALQFS